MSDTEQIRAEVRQAYGAVARAEGGSCCGSQPAVIAGERLGYSAAELAAVPEGANLGLGCGNPQAIAALKAGETVLDLGSGAGFDCFLAAAAVGASGRVIGVDMTADMVAKARANAGKAGHGNVEFRLGEIEALPVADATVDAIISNCVINLSTDKARVFREAFRVLKPGGRLAISDVVASNELPESLRQNLHLYSCCIGGASPVAELEAALAAAGFREVRIAPKDESREFIRDWAPGRGVEDFVVSASIEAVKPGPAPRQQGEAPPLHASIVALAALAANIAANHPKQGLCQVDKLHSLGVAEAHIATVIEIARHLRDEAGQLLDMAFDEQTGATAAPQAPAPAPVEAAKPKVVKGVPLAIPVVQSSACCTPTKSGQSCC